MTLMLTLVLAALGLLGDVAPHAERVIIVDRGEMLVSNDAYGLIEARERVVVSGVLRVESVGNTGDAPALTIRAGRVIEIDGSVLLSDGGIGGRGASLRLIAPLIVLHRNVVAGAGGDAEPGQPGGDGGFVLCVGHTVGVDSRVLRVAGGAGGSGGEGSRGGHGGIAWCISRPTDAGPGIDWFSPPFARYNGSDGVSAIGGDGGTGGDRASGGHGGSARAANGAPGRHGRSGCDAGAPGESGQRGGSGGDAYGGQGGKGGAGTITIRGGTGGSGGTARGGNGARGGNAGDGAPPGSAGRGGAGGGAKGGNGGEGGYNGGLGGSGGGSSGGSSGTTGRGGSPCG